MPSIKFSIRESWIGVGSTELNMIVETQILNTQKKFDTPSIIQSCQITFKSTASSNRKFNWINVVKKGDGGFWEEGTFYPQKFTWFLKKITKKENLEKRYQ